MSKLRLDRREFASLLSFRQQPAQDSNRSRSREGRMSFAAPVLHRSVASGSLDPCALVRLEFVKETSADAGPASRRPIISPFFIRELRRHRRRVMTTLADPSLFL